MPLSGFQFGKQAGPVNKPTFGPTTNPAPRPNTGSMRPVPIPNARIPKPGATLSATPIPNNPIKGTMKPTNM